MPGRLPLGARVGLAVLIGGVAAVGFLTDLSRVLARADPIRAAAIGIRDGQTVAAAARQYVTQTPDGDSSAEAADLAREALRLDPTATDALEALALIAQLENEPARVKRLLGYSLALSRREVRSHLWAIEKAVSRGDITLALDRYDLALRVSESAQINLFPVLAAATVEPLVRRGLVQVLARKPNWGDRFLTHVSENSSSAPSAGALFTEARAKGVPVSKTQWINLVAGLIAEREYDKAWASYRQLNPAARRDRARDPRFTREPVTAFEWMASDEMGISVSVSAQQDGGRIEVIVGPGSRSTVLNQMQLLPSGGYRLWGAGEVVAGDDLPTASWSVTCAGGRELARIPLRILDELKLSFDGNLTITSDCPVQELRLDMSSAVGADGVTISLNTVRLEPVGPGA